MPDTITHITTSGGLISAAFIESIREPGSRQRGVETVCFALGSAATTLIRDEERRAHLCTELDGLYAHLHDLEHDELAYILETFTC